MLDSDLPQDGVAVVGHDDAAHRVHQHLQHGPRAQARPDHIGDCLRADDEQIIDGKQDTSACCSKIDNLVPILF